MAALPPVFLEIRAKAAQFYDELAKVAEATTAMADETTAATEGMSVKVSESATNMGARVATAAEVMAAKSAEEAEAMARSIIGEAEQMDAGASAAAEEMARNIAASFEAMTAKTTAAMEAQNARTTAAMEAQAAKVSAMEEIMANNVAASAARREAAEARAAKATSSAATETEASGIRMQESFTKTALVAASSMGTITAAVTESALKQGEAAASSQASMLGIANGISKVAVASAAVVAAVSLDMAAKFEKSTMLLVTAGGEAKGALDGVRQGILQISTDTGTSAEQVSEGMYVMEKAGMRGAAGLGALRAAAEGAKDENVDLSIMTQGLSDLLLDYGTNTKNAADVTRDSIKYTNELVAASGAAKTTMTDFANSLSAVVPIASVAGISFDQVGGAIATMTQHGQTAQQSSQNLANLIQSLVRPNNQASAAMSQLGIDTTDLAEHLGERGLSGTLKVVDSAIKSHMQGDLVFMGSMKDNKNAVNDLNAALSKMPAPLADAAKGLLTGTTSQKDFTKAAKDTGGAAGAVADQFLSLYKSTYGLSDNFKAGKPAAETYSAALRDVLGNATAVRAAQMLLMNNSREFEANITAIGDAGKKTGKDIATWADMQDTLSIQLDQSKQMMANLGIELGTKLVPAAKGAISGFTDLVHGFEQGNPVLLGVAGVIGGALLISTVNLTAKMVTMGLKAAGTFIQMGADALAQSSLFVKGMTADEMAIGQFSTKAELAGAKVKGMGPALTGLAAGITAVALAANIAGPAMDKILKPTGATADALNKFAGEASKGSVSADTLNKSFADLVEHKDGVSDFQQAINGIADPGVWGNIDNITTGGIKVLSLGMLDLKSTSEEARSRFADMGNTLAQMDPTQAITAFQQLSLKTDGSNQSMVNLMNDMPAFRDSLSKQAQAAGLATDDQTLLNIAIGKTIPSMNTFKDAAGNVKPITPELQKSLDDAGVSANGLATDLQKVLTGLESTGLANLSARDAQFQFTAAIQSADKAAKDLKDKLGGDLSSALNKAGTDFNTTTDAGKQAEDQFAAVTRAGFAQADAMAKNGASQQDLQNVMTDTYHKMQDTAQEFGMGADKADALTRSVLGIPPGVDITTWIDDYAQKKADQLTNTLNNMPTHKEIDILISQRTQHGTDALNDAQNGGGPGGYTGGSVDSIMGLAGGGVVPGRPPSNPHFDNIMATVNGRPLRVQSGEFIVNGAQTRANRPWLDAINGGMNMDDLFAPRTPALAYAPSAVAQQPGTAVHAAGPVTNNTTKSVTNNVSITSTADAQSLAGEFSKLTASMF